MKKFLIKITCTILAVAFIFLSVTIYLVVYVYPKMTGDLGRLAFIPFGQEYEELQNQLALHDTLFQTISEEELLRKNKVEILSVGDSFAQQNNAGFQNYLCEMGYNVVNYANTINPLQTAYILMAQNYIDSANVSVLVVETVEREFVYRMANFDSENFSIKKVAKDVTPTRWSLSRTRDYILFKLGHRSPILSASLNQDLFTCSDAKLLYFYQDDINTPLGISEFDKLKSTYNTLRLKAKEKGIKLILLVAVDKYDLYQDFIVDNPYPRKTINEDIERIFGERSGILLSKKCLLPYVERGEKDIFLFNDTHWSCKSARIVAEEIHKRITDSLFIQ